MIEDYEIYVSDSGQRILHLLPDGAFIPEDNPRFQEFLDAAEKKESSNAG